LPRGTVVRFDVESYLESYEVKEEEEIVEETTVNNA
jgi:hypothetical protein